MAIRSLGLMEVNRRDLFRLSGGLTLFGLPVVARSQTVAMPERRAFIERLPKVEIHLHLEGAIPLDALWELITKYGGDPSVPDPKSL